MSPRTPILHGKRAEWPGRRGPAAEPPGPGAGPRGHGPANQNPREPFSSHEALLCYRERTRGEEGGWAPWMGPGRDECGMVRGSCGMPAIANAGSPDSSGAWHRLGRLTRGINGPAVRWRSLVRAIRPATHRSLRGPGSICARTDSRRGRRSCPWRRRPCPPANHGRDPIGERSRPLQEGRRIRSPQRRIVNIVVRPPVDVLDYRLF
jgi:hypothetical protein